ncbi:restriction endonuclease subunit S [Microbacterium sp. RU33B]|uniref:restriction endonuclease subunit S n=1 Tax=Microbacterium sp. RU33B TaxID=1907390 RepID=UPI00095FEF36|nr:restriction endonuclease subunit S [Microbacterium sp. RU33B]SIT72090.1 Restriction endonuclease S subunit [Microbacterium sp. RU33B]
MASFRTVFLGDLFELKNGKTKFIRSYVESNPGTYPVYSASLRQVFGSIDTYDYDGHHLTWIMNGYGGCVQEIHGPFSANRDRGVLVPLEGISVPDLTYLRYAVEPQLRAAAVGRRVDGSNSEYTKVYPDAAAQVSMELPETDSGDLDYTAMARVGMRLRRIEAAKVHVASSQSNLMAAELRIECAEPFIDISLGDANYFELTIGERRLMKDNLDHGVPVYSANVRRPFGLAESTALAHLDEQSLIWGIDGTFDWNLMAAGYEFEATDHCGRVRILDSKLDPTYLLQALRSTRSRYGFDRVFRASMGNIGRVVTVRVPIDNKGRPSLGRQRKLAEEHEKLEAAKQASLDALERVLAAKPRFDA